MAKRELKNFIDGQYVAAQSGKTSEIIDPAKGVAFADAPVSDAADVDAAYQAADRAFDSWSKSTPDRKSVV